MLGRSDFQRSSCESPRLARESVTVTSQFLEVSRSKMSKVRTTYIQCSKTSLVKQNSERKEKLSERDRQVMKLIVTSKKQTTAAKVTTKLFQHLDSPVSIITVRRLLHKQNIYGRAAITKPLVTDVNAKCCLQWCHTHKNWSIDKGKKVICFDEWSFTLFRTTGRVHV
ncbi:transposable element Tcb1 transposase [Trichonephila clavipes]|uniref:Transposable element Tcb1 transposase n=1 Tax=Trichonephila clavipes TaxID=2585209 RepID=A0A8X6W424_TRICX|nr:transposable element Tcb1 transposase [Trichonephila clavipes]